MAVPESCRLTSVQAHRLDHNDITSRLTCKRARCKADDKRHIAISGFLLVLSEFTVAMPRTRSWNLVPHSDELT